MERVPGSDWFYCDGIGEEAPLRLFSFPGHNRTIEDFSGWSTVLGGDSVERYYVALPGRGPRSDEEPITDSAKLLDALVSELLTHMDKPFALFGHSIGAHLAWAVCRELVLRGLPQPRRLFLSGAAPLPPAPPGKAVAMPPPWRACLQPDGTMPPALAADLAVLQGLASKAPSGRPHAEFTCPITAFGPVEAGQQLRTWGGHTTGEMSFEPVDSAAWSKGPLEATSPLLKQLETILHSDVSRSRKESIALIERWNAGRQPYPDTSCLHDLFRESAAANPDAVAVVFQDRQMTFSELDKQTDILAAWLIEAGVRVGGIVGIFMEHCEAYAIAFIAAHKAGGAYMPLEVVYPADLLRRVLEEAKPAVVLTTRHYSHLLPDWQTKLEMDFDGPWLEHALSAPAPPADLEQPTPDTLAYVVMSSGTTGVPKGICCPHRGAVHSYFYRLVAYPYAPGDREACSVFFVWEMLRPLLGGLPAAGGLAVPLYIIPDDVIYNPAKLVHYLRDNAITRVLFTPSLLQLVLDTCTAAELQEGLRSMRIIWLCGEVVTVELRDKMAQILPHVQLENLYSISECHDISYANLNTLNTRESPKYAPCGTVIPNVTAFILDDQMRQVPVGVPGRMYIGGPCLALGYLNMPEKTRERFVPNPHRPGETLYDTGDRCRYLPSGSIEVIGRCDFMVKIRGYSVVIGAVEAAISEHPLVSTACVLTEGDEGSMDKKLVAYVVPERWERVPSAASIQRFVRNKLPPYAIPSVFLLLDSMPINMASGKLDRKKLPPSHSKAARAAPATGNDFVDAKDVDAIDAQRTMENGSPLPLKPLTACELTIAGIWTSVLKLGKGHDADSGIIGSDSDFFDLGGHSLLLVKVAAAIKAETGVEVTMKELLEMPTLKSISNFVSTKLKATSTAMTPTERAVGAIWTSLLKLDEGSVTPSSDFFELGGHSLLLAKVAAGICAETRVEVSMKDLLSHSMLKSLAEFIADRIPPSSPGGGQSPTSQSLERTKTEQKVAEVWASVLQVDESTINPNTDFYQHGGSSQLMESVAGFIKSGLGIELSLPDVLSRPRLRSLSILVDSVATAMGVNGATLVDLPAEAAKLDASIYPAPTRKAGYSRFRVGDTARPPSRILITGVTGYLGAHILAQGLKSCPNVSFYCLVRAKDEDKAAQRIESTLRALSLWPESKDGQSINERIIPVVGDLSRPLLGLNLQEFKALAGELDAIIHAGAKVDLVRSYHSLKACNVLGTQEVLRLAVTNGFATRVKPVHFISTNGVFPFGNGGTFAEDADMDSVWQGLEDGYARSKWVAEQMCVEARNRGLPVSILRPGNMGPSSVTGTWNASDFIYLMLKAVLDVGCAPGGEDTKSWKVDLTPVDYAAKAIIHCTAVDPGKALGRILHVQNPRPPVEFEQVIQWMESSCGESFERLPFDAFRSRILEAASAENASNCILQVAAGLESFAAYLIDPGDFGGTTVAAAMESVEGEEGGVCPLIDDKLFAVYTRSLLDGAPVLGVSGEGGHKSTKSGSFVMDEIGQDGLQDVHASEVES